MAETRRPSMSDRQSQAHSTHQSPFNGWFKKTLRLNRDHKSDINICLKVTGYRENITKINSVTKARSSDRRGNVPWLDSSRILSSRSVLCALNETPSWKQTSRTDIQ